MYPSGGMQGTLPALRAEADICVPYLLQEVRHLQAGKPLFESLMPLQPEDQRKVSFPAAVVQETVVTDLLKQTQRFLPVKEHREGRNQTF